MWPGNAMTIYILLQQRTHHTHTIINCLSRNIFFVIYYLQLNFSHPVLGRLPFFSCHNYLTGHFFYHFFLNEFKIQLKIDQFSCMMPSYSGCFCKKQNRLKTKIRGNTDWLMHFQSEIELDGIVFSLHDERLYVNFAFIFFRFVCRVQCVRKCEISIKMNNMVVKMKWAAKFSSYFSFHTAETNLESSCL